MKYLSALKTNYKHLGVENEDFLAPPANIIDPELFIIGWNPFRAPPTKDEKQSSIIVIFSCWKTMIGTAVTSLPWAF
jgi:hypothetical protein